MKVEAVKRIPSIPALLPLSIIDAEFVIIKIVYPKNKRAYIQDIIRRIKAAHLCENKSPKLETKPKKPAATAHIAWILFIRDSSNPDANIDTGIQKLMINHTQPTILISDWLIFINFWMHNVCITGRKTNGRRSCRRKHRHAGSEEPACLAVRCMRCWELRLLL